MLEEIDLLIDGADEVDRSMIVMKGSRGAMTRERILCWASNRTLFMVNEKKVAEDQVGVNCPFPIAIMAYGFPNMVAQPGALDAQIDQEKMPARELFSKTYPIVILVMVVLGGIYAGLYTPTEAGAAGAFVAFLFALVRRQITVRKLWDVLVETGHITATLLFLIIAASMYSRMLGISGLPTELGRVIGDMNASFVQLMIMYVVILIILGTIIDSVSIMLIAVPLFLVVLKPFDVDLVWFGVVTVIAVEIGLLTPPLGLAVYVIKSTLVQKDISLADIFIGAAPFALVMLVVLILVMIFPQIPLFLVELKQSFR